MLTTLVEFATLGLGVLNLANNNLTGPFPEYVAFCPYYDDNSAQVVTDLSERLLGPQQQQLHVRSFSALLRLAYLPSLAVGRPPQAFKPMLGHAISVVILSWTPAPVQARLGPLLIVVAALVPNISCLR